MIGMPDKSNDSLARILTASNFEKRILDNTNLSLAEIVQIVFDSAQELSHGIYSNLSSLSSQAEPLRVAANNLVLFFKSLVIANNLVPSVLKEMVSNDYRTCRHAVNVCLYSIYLATVLEKTGRLKIDQQGYTDLCVGALLHDIGKVKLSKRILEKKGHLTSQEFDSIKKHPAFGARILANTGKYSECVIDIVKQHHEDWEGSGYPEKLQYQQISFYSRIVCIADSFDALTSNKTYRKYFSSFDALVTMKKKVLGKYYSPYLDVFIKSLGESTARF